MAKKSIPDSVYAGLILSSEKSLREESTIFWPMNKLKYIDFKIKCQKIKCQVNESFQKFVV